MLQQFALRGPARQARARRLTRRRLSCCGAFTAVCTRNIVPTQTCSTYELEGNERIIFKNDIQMLRTNI